MRVDRVCITKLKNIKVVVSPSGISQLKVSDVATLQRQGTSSIWSSEYFKVDISNYDPNTNLTYVVKNGVHYENVISKFITMYLRSMHLDGLSKQKGLSEVQKRRIEEEADEVNRQLTKLGDIDIIGANIVVGAFGIVNNIVYTMSADPILSFVEGVSEWVPEDTESVYDLDFSGIPSDQVELVKSKITEQLGAKFDQIKTSMGVDKLFAKKNNLASCQINVDKDLVEYMVMNRHLLSTCPDLIFNLLLLKSEYSADELFGKGLELKIRLYDLSTRYEFSKSAISKRSFIITVNDLLEDITGHKIEHVLLVNDIEPISASWMSDAFATMWNSFTPLQIVSLCHKYSKSIIDNNGTVIIKDDTGSDLVRFDRFFPAGVTTADIQLLGRILVQLTYIVYGRIKINSMLDDTFEVDLRDILRYLEKGLKDG